MRRAESTEIGRPGPGALVPETCEDLALYHWLKAQERQQGDVGWRLSLRVYAWYRDGKEPPGDVWYFVDLKPTPEEVARGFVPAVNRPVDTEPEMRSQFRVDGYYLYQISHIRSESLPPGNESW